MEEIDGTCASCGTDEVAVLHHNIFEVRSDLDV